MTAFVVILAALQLAVPVRCYETPTVWQAAKLEARVDAAAVGFYSPRYYGSPYIALGPNVCRSVRRAGWLGAFVLGHEMEHYRQDIEGRSFDEAEADRAGWAHLARWQARLRSLFRLPLNAVVRLTP